jgi:drug/metabolite transporter (DMT)-like permease
VHPPPPSRGKVVAALSALYVIWGSTYLAIRLALPAFPPLLMSGSRFVLAGAVLYAVARARGAPRPAPRQLGAAALVGAFLVGANAMVSVAEQWVSSSLAAVLIASVPLWVVLAAGLWREWPTRSEWLGVAVGLAGVAVLQGGGELRASPGGAALLVLSTWSWALGSMWSRRLPMPPGLVAPAMEMLCGGGPLLAASLLRGDRPDLSAGTGPIAAWLFLVIFGSLVAFTAYAWLLPRVRPALATSYAYVNPAVAVGLGALWGEPVGARSLGALSLILGGVALVAAVRRPRT